MPARASTSDFERSCRQELQEFLRTGERLLCPRADAPRVSVVVALWNRAELTLCALRSVGAQANVSLDVVLVDNGSTDDTPLLLERLEGPTVLTNATNLGFTLAANQGARAARGELLLFLNSDAVLHSGAVQGLIEALERSNTIGAVGGKLIWPDGRLQEAGGVVWPDGSYETCGRGGDPAAPEYSREREVDLCSGAMLQTPRELFLRLGGFDERYRPAYYEDVDYCVRLWRNGMRVVYTPDAAATHVENASSTSPDDPLTLQRERQSIFVSLHKEWLASQSARSDGIGRAQSRRPTGP